MSYLLTAFGYFIALPIMVMWLLNVLGNSRVQKTPKLFKSDGLMGKPLGAGQGFIVVILMISLVAICERVLFDLSRTIVVPDYHYFDSLQTIMVHALFIVPVLVAFIIINVLVGQYREKYAVILMPYFVTAMLLTMQLIVEITVYFANHHTTAELYVVLFCIVFIASYAIWYVQNLYNKRLREMKV